MSSSSESSDSSSNSIEYDTFGKDSRDLYKKYQSFLSPQEAVNLFKSSTTKSLLGHGRDSSGKSKGLQVLRCTQILKPKAVPPFEGIIESSKFDETTKKIKNIRTKTFHKHSNTVVTFHGTKPDTVSHILNGDVENRGLSKGMFGKAIYCSDNPAKCDMYTGKLGKGASRFIFVCLQIMGNEPFITNKSLSNIERPPCKKGCSHLCNHDRSTSVLAESQENGGTMKFREFMSYDRKEVLPLYLIEYTRVGETNVDITKNVKKSPKLPYNGDYSKAYYAQDYQAMRQISIHDVKSRRDAAYSRFRKHMFPILKKQYKLNKRKRSDTNFAILPKHFDKTIFASWSRLPKIEQERWEDPNYYGEPPKQSKPSFFKRFFTKN